AKARAVLLSLLAAGAAAGSVGLWLARSGVGPQAFTILGGRLVRAYGTFGQPNPFGGYMNMVWPLGAALVVWWIARALGVDWATPEGQKLVVPDERAAPANASVPTWLAAAGTVAVTVCGAAVLASWSRGAWLAAGVAALVMAGAVAAGMVRPGVRGRAGAVALVLLALALAVPLSGLTADLPASVAARLGSIVDTFAVWGVADAEVDDSSFATIERVAHWEAAAAMWADSPWLGQGPGQYEIVYDRYRLPLWAEPLGHAHNYYLHLLAETGLVGLAGYLAFFGSALLLAVRRAVRPATPLEGALALGVLGVLAATAAHSLVDNVYVHETTVHLGLALGAMVAAGSIAARSATDVSATSALLASGSAAARQLAPGPIAGGRRGSPARGAE
ncbi:MAG: O-antigen ligase family protein, partial [Anaerolineae bacterium]